MRSLVRFLTLKPSFGLLIDARGRDLRGIDATLRTLREQLYEGWIARVLVDEPADDAMLTELHAAVAQDARVTIVPPGGTFTPKQLQLEKRSGKLYWSDREGMRVMRANRDGSEIEILVDTSLGLDFEFTVITAVVPEPTCDSIRSA